MLATGMGQFLIANSWQVLALLVLIVCSALVNGAETAVFCLSRGEMFRLRHDVRRVARLVPVLMRDPSSVLTSILLSNTIIQVLYFVTGSLLILRIEQEVDHGGLWGMAAAVTTFLAIVLLGEIMPKTAAFLSPLKAAPLVAPALTMLIRVARPIHRFLSLLLVGPLTRVLAPTRRRQGELSADELANLLALSQKRGLIGQDQTELLQEVLDLTGLKAGDVMVPRVDIVAYDVNGLPAGLLELVRQRRVTKVPVYEGDRDHVVGVVQAKHLLMAPERPVRELLSPVQFVPETARLERVLLQFRASGSQMGIVVDEYGGTAGLITLESVLEEIVGDIADVHETHRGPAVQRVGPGEWLVDGDLPVHEWAETFLTDLRGARFTTVGGFVISLLGRIPRVGQTATYRNVGFTVEAVRGRRIALLRVRIKEVQP